MAKVPANHVVPINIVKISQAEMRREHLAEQYSKILDDVSLELSRKQAFLFPAIDRYCESPSPERWMEVQRNSQDSLARIQVAMNEEVEYQSQQRLVDLVQQTTTTVSAGKDLPQALPPPGGSFSAALGIHSQRQVTLSELPPGSMPDVGAVRVWAGHIENLYREMDSELTKLVAELRD